MNRSNCCTPRSRSFPGVGAAWLGDVFPGVFPATMACAPAEAANETAESATYRLPIDVIEKNGGFVVTASVPGFKKDEISVEFNEGTLTVAAKRAASSDQEGTDAGVTWHRRERRSVNLVRSIRLPDGITGDGITATVVDGILTVTVPQPPSKQPHKVTIN